MLSPISCLIPARFQPCLQIRDLEEGDLFTFHDGDDLRTIYKYTGDGHFVAPHEDSREMWDLTNSRVDRA